MSGIKDEPSLFPPFDKEYFLDPWAGKHEGAIPKNALLIGVWRIDLGTDDDYEALFLQRSERQDRVWSVTMFSEKAMRQGLTWRRRHKPDWAASKLRSGCIAAAVRHGSTREAATRLLDAIVRARIHYDSFRAPFIAGILTRGDLARILEAIRDELTTI